jgi:hypothetical protein
MTNVYILIIFILIILLLINYNNLLKINIEEIKIEEKQLIANDAKLLEILHNIKSINPYITNFYDKLNELLEDFYATHKTLLLNVNNIYIKPNELVKPFKLNIVHRNILKNDLRDQLERILKHIEEMIYVIPSQEMYLNAYYNFNKLINEHLSKMYSQINTIPQYQIYRKDANYDFF